MALAAEQEKVAALAALKQRREANKNIKKVDNSKLYAGSPMYYYCVSCNAEIVLPETHTCAAPPLCKKCEALNECGWLE